jgi:hypothetical protein
MWSYLELYIYPTEPSAGLPKSCETIPLIHGIGNQSAISQSYRKNKKKLKIIPYPKLQKKYNLSFMHCVEYLVWAKLLHKELNKKCS